MTIHIDRRQAVTGLAGLGQIATPARAGVRRDDLVLRELKPGIWLHSSSSSAGGVAHNGLVVVGASRALLIDPAATSEHSVALLDHLRPIVGSRAMDFVATHAAAERAPGWGGGEPPPSGDRRLYDLGERQVEFFYPGPGRARVNAVAYEPATRTLYGGLVIAGRRAGTTADLDGEGLGAWPLAVLNVAHAYRDAEFVVPRFGEPGGFELLVATEQRSSIANLRSSSGGSARGRPGASNV